MMTTDPFERMITCFAELWFVHQPYFILIWALWTLGNELIDHHIPEEEHDHDEPM